MMSSLSNLRRDILSDSVPQDNNQVSDNPVYHGQERRKSQPSVIVEQHAGPMPPGHSDMTIWQKAWSNFGALGIGAMLFVSLFFFFQGMYKDEIQERRTRDAEDREIRRAEVAQTDRRAEQMAGELRLMRISFESIATRIETGTTRMEGAKIRLEQLAKDMEMMIKQLLDSVKKQPTKFLNPMFHLIDAILSPPEMAPMPRVLTHS